MTRVEPHRVADERGSLTSQLAFQRETLLMKVDGLDDESLRRPMTPSVLSLLGPVRHLTVTEHGWFLGIFDGEPDAYDVGDDTAEFQEGSRGEPARDPGPHGPGDGPAQRSCRPGAGGHRRHDRHVTRSSSLTSGP